MRTSGKTFGKRTGNDRGASTEKRDWKTGKKEDRSRVIIRIYFPEGYFVSARLMTAPE